MLVLSVQCARSGLEPDDLVVGGFTASGGTPADAGRLGSGGVLTQGGLLGSGGTSNQGGSTNTEPHGCTPSTETCNGQDDDCDGKVDEIDPRACPGGGFSYCVAGKMSACPKRCETCVPGSERVCFVSYCSSWGRQTCTADGRTFGVCEEELKIPSVCRHAAPTLGGDLRDLAQCCLEQGFCCSDSEDLDNDGDRRESVGRCEDVTCD